MHVMGVTTKNEAVNAALSNHVARVRRLEAAEKPAERGTQGEFDEAAAAHRTAKRVRP